MRRGSCDAATFAASLFEKGIDLRCEGDVIRYRAAKDVLTPELRTLLPSRKAALQGLLRHSHWYSAASRSQHSAFLLARLEPNNAGAMRLVPPALYNGLLDIDAFIRAVRQLVSRHEALRAGFVDWNGHVAQEIADEVDLSINVVDIAPDGYEAARDQELSRPFDLARPPLIRVLLFRVSARQFIPLILVHEIVSDGSSLGVIAREIGQLYAGEVLPPAAQWRDFVQEELSYLRRPDFPDVIEHWRRGVVGATVSMNWPAPKWSAAPPTESSFPFEVTGGLAESLDGFARAQSVTLFMLLLAAFQAVVWKRTGMANFIVAYPVANRDSLRDQSLIGRAMNMLAVCADLSGELSWLELLKRVRTSVLEAWQYRNLPIEKLLETAGRRHAPAGNPLFQVTFALQPPPALIELQGLNARPLAASVTHLPPGIELALQLWKDRDILRGIFGYANSLFDTTSVESLTHEFISTLAAMMMNPNEPLAPSSPARVHLVDLLPDWRITPKAGKQTAPASFTPSIRAGTDLAVAHGGSLDETPASRGTLPEVLAAVARDFPDREIISVTSTGAERITTYAALLDTAGRVANGLYSAGLRPAARVALQLSECIDTIEAFWGCIVGHFVPLILAPNKASELSGARRVLGDIYVVNDDNLPGLRLEPQALPALPATEPGEVAFLTLSSGSTSEPKCVMLTHRNLLARAHGANQLCGNSSQDICLTWLPFSHIGAISDWHIRPLCLACRSIYVPTDEILKCAIRWLYYLSHYRATHSWSPNFVFALINELFRRGADFEGDLSQVKALITGGEGVSLDVIDEFARHTGLYGLRRTAIRPAFGMAELASGVTYAVDASGPSCFRDKFVDLGPVIPGLSIRIANDANEIMQMGQPGRVQFRGDAVFPGYVGTPRRDGDRFLKDEWFDSGDLGFLERGRLAITGRAEERIVVRGVNFSSQQIEECVEKTPGVDASFTAACALSGPEAGQDQLAIFFSPSDFSQLALEAVLRGIRGNIARDLGLTADYLIPVEKQSVLKTSIGKIQRSGLRQQLLAGAFDGQIKKADLILGSSSTMPRWYFRRRWRRCAATLDTKRNQPRHCLVLSDHSRVGRTLCRELARTGASVIELGPGMHDFLPDNLSVDHVFDVSGCDEDAPAATSALLNLIRALHQAGHEQVRFILAATGSQSVFDSEPVRPDRSALLGLLNAARQELPWLECSHVDLQSGSLEEDARLLLFEAGATFEPEVAFREGHRWIPCLEPVHLDQHEKFPLPFSRDGLCLVTGGCGGIGRLLSEHLAGELGLTLLLTGLSPSTACGEWLARFKDNVRYAAVDVCDGRAMRQVVEAAEGKYSRKLKAVIHLAGVASDRSVLEIDNDHLNAVLRPKSKGSEVLCDLLLERGGGLFIAFSSINATIGSARTAAYAMANRYLEAFTSGLHDPITSYCLRWSMWDEVGMSRGYPWKRASRSRGFHSMPSRSGLHSFLAALHARQTDLVIGLDSHSPEISARHLSAVAPATGARSIVEPRTPLESQLAALWREVLGVDVVGLREDFFELGGHSLMAARLIAELKRELDVELPLRALFDYPTIEGLARVLESNGEKRRWDEIERASRTGTHPLASAQLGLWILWCFEPSSCAYHIPLIVRLEGAVDSDVLRLSLDELVRRHEPLRTTFLLEKDGVPIQAIQPPAPASLEEIDFSNRSQTDRDWEFRQLCERETERPFDLSSDRLFRVSLVRLGAEEYALLLTLHHVIADGQSVSVLVRELAKLYESFSAGRASPLPDLFIQYVDYSHWRRRRLTADWVERRITACRQELEGWTRLELPLQRRPTADRGDRRGAAEEIVFSHAVTARLVALGSGGTLFMSLLALFSAALHCYSGQCDLLIGTDFADREDPRTTSMVGLLVNQVPLRVRFGPESTFREVATAARRAVVNALEWRDVPFDTLVRALKPVREPGRSPLFDVKLVLNEGDARPTRAGAIVIHPPRIETRTAITDLMLNVTHGFGCIEGELRYRTSLFEARTIRQLRAALIRTAEMVSFEPDITMSRLREALTSWLPLGPSGETASMAHVEENVPEKAMRPEVRIK